MGVDQIVVGEVVALIMEGGMDTLGGGEGVACLIGHFDQYCMYFGKYHFGWKC